MLNALKTPFSNDRDANDAAGVNEENFYKSKRSLLVLFLLVFVIGVFGLFLNQNEPIVAEKKIPQPSIVTPSKSRGATSPSLPVVEKSDPATIPNSLPKEDKLKLAYKGDSEYLTLNRYERISRVAIKSTRTQRPRVRDTVTPGDKPLALAGKGFDLQGLQLGRHVDFPHRLQKPLLKPVSIPEDYLDLRLTQAKSAKDLIFHPLRQALGEDSRQSIHQEDEKPEMKKTQVLEGVSETKLLLLEGGDSFLILRPGRESLDLLGGNEKINRKKYNRW